MPAAEGVAPVSTGEAATLFADLAAAPALLLAVSGGPDSTALLLLAARWRATLAQGPSLLAATVDHQLRPESAAEARAVGALAGRLAIPHRILRWTGAKPRTALQEAARSARYRLLAAEARSAGAAHILTGHTRDDQAETVLLRMARGSALTGLGAMARAAPLQERHHRARHAPAGRPPPLLIVRPLLDLPKARLLATLEAEGLAFADDPSNRDPRFTRARLRQLMPQLAEEGLTARRLAQLARRLRRADAAIESMVDAAARAQGAAQPGGPVRLDAEIVMRLPAEVALRLIGRAIARTAGEPPARLKRLESLCEALAGAAPAGGHRIRRSLAGALITLAGGTLTIERAPPRTRPSSPRGRTLTTRTTAARSIPDPR
ncbi:MAG: tRNA lysidine(34) synthetase TilS [Alphaproteobacteria bacterium]|nr:tRNA lysidine(34) synthetase TilS [Alphaproteobacteria bacterium]